MAAVLAFNMIALMTSLVLLIWILGELSGSGEHWGAVYAMALALLAIAVELVVMLPATLWVCRAKGGAAVSPLARRAPLVVLLGALFVHVATLGLLFGDDYLDKVGYQRDNPFSTSTLYDAMRSGDLERVERLLRNDRALASLEDSSGETPLRFAVEYGSLALTETLVAGGADVNHTDQRGHTALHAAAAANELEQAELLIGRGARINARSRDGTPLHSAAHTNSRMAKLLLDHGADIRVVDDRGRTALHDAVIQKNPEVAELLITAGTEVGVQDEEGNTPLHLVAELSFGQDPESQQRESQVSELLLKHGAAVEARNAHGETPLHCGAHNSSAAAVESLLAHGAGVESRDIEGSTPLHAVARSLAAVERRLKATGLLNTAGADVNARDARGATPLHGAAAEGQPEVVDWLLAHGATVDARDRDDWTPLHMVATRKRTWTSATGQPVDQQIAQSLIAGGADVNGRNKQGLTPRALAERGNAREMVNLLLARGAK